MYEFDVADIIISVSPSYWADIPGSLRHSSTDVHLGLTSIEYKVDVEPRKQEYLQIMEMLNNYSPIG